jgi:glycosyltransferase involved in cell wall biosynthesis
MKIVIVNFSETKGGAAKAAKRLHLALLENNIDSTYLTQFKETTDKTVIGNTSKLSVIKAKFAVKLEEIPLKKYSIKKNASFSASLTGTKKIIDQINKLNPDIVHLHWINAGMFSIHQIKLINAKIVWSLHDMWAYTGGCHYSGDCDKFKTTCGSCYILESKNFNDLSNKVFFLKQNVYSKKNITFIGLSKWMANLAKESSLLKNQSVVNIPNPIDVNLFYPISKIEARKQLKLPLNKKLILFGAMNATSDPRKGYKHLNKALNELNIDNVELAIFGTNKVNKPLKFKTHTLGYIYNDEHLNLIYNAADVMIVPSVQENLSNAIVESLSSGTPVVAFNIGGNSDMIEHKLNGYLAKAFDSIDLANGIKYVLQNKNLSINAREKVMRTFEKNIVAKQYIKLYNKILHNE